MKIMLGTVLSLWPYSPGKAWHRLHYLVGLQKLGHEVYLVEEMEPEWCVDERGQRVGFEQSVNRDLLRATLEPFGLMDRACVIYDRGEATLGRSRDSLIALSRDADLLINWSGHVKSDFILSNVKRRVYLDLDPVFTQIWHDEYGLDLNFKQHDVFFSAGLNIGTPDSDIPDCGLEWHHMLPPVVLEYWPFHIDGSGKRFTTIATLSPFGEVWYRGERYGSKHEELRRLAELPRRVRPELEVAVNYCREEETGLGLLKANGWFVSDAGAIADLGGYQSFIARSRAEIGIAQNAYVKGCSGWFSDRWSHYLASGKPVLAQSTGLERLLPAGRGLLTFGGMEEAVEGIEMIERDYASHCRAAREFAEEVLDYRKVLPRMLEACTAG